MKMREINSVRIFGKPYKVIWLNEGNNYAILNGLIGKTIPTDQIIYISKDSADEVKIDTFFHEIIHCISRELGLKLSEERVQGLSCGIANFLIDNVDKLVFSK